jgi:hypothetical protein
MLAARQAALHQSCDWGVPCQSTGPPRERVGDDQSARPVGWRPVAGGDLGSGYFDRRTDPEREAQRLIARLEALGKHVTLNDAA